jgi:ComF family protein
MMDLRKTGVDFIKGLLDLLCPPRCLLCGAFPEGEAEGDYLCPDCLAGWTPLDAGVCRVCGRPFLAAESSAHLCGSCIERRPRYDLARGAGVYEESLREAVRALKYRNRTELARKLGDFMAENLPPPLYPPEADLVMPVPLSSRRLRSRGFNQALVLARRTYRLWPEKVRWDLLIRSRHTPPQVGLSEVERKRNVRKAFRVEDPAAVDGRSIILVDDVYTTGATVEECAAALKKAGADRVMVVTLARAV